MAEKRKRDGRVPLHKQKRIGVQVSPGFVGRLANDVDDRISKLQKAGYRMITRSNAVREGQKDAADASQLGNVASQSVGGGVTGYYMEIPEKHYREDQIAKQKENDRVMGEIGILDTIPKKARRGKLTLDSPNKKIKIEH